ncbi:hypothetical protein E3N88_19701 [Mikania micrantha]|uniref:Uncharacterized protein n=1 Tax=Mikania micrantha TaxID=192012 RepID=A0A5N6NRD9_9ASTR|nr:hypothetical protein E3N88_19701 [Mikania micrantha]
MSAAAWPLLPTACLSCELRPWHILILAAAYVLLNPSRGTCSSLDRGLRVSRGPAPWPWLVIYSTSSRGPRLLLSLTQPRLEPLSWSRLMLLLSIAWPIPKHDEYPSLVKVEAVDIVHCSMEGSSMTQGTHEEIDWFQAMFGFQINGQADIARKAPIEEVVRLQTVEAEGLLHDLGIQDRFSSRHSPRGIFCSRTLNLRSISALDIGLFIDKEKGNMVKADRFGYVKRAMHGTKLLSIRAVRLLVRPSLRLTWKGTKELFVDPDPELPLALMDQKELRYLLWMCFHKVVTRQIMSELNLDGQGFEVDEQLVISTLQGGSTVPIPPAFILDTHVEADAADIVHCNMEGSSMTQGTHEKINWFQAMLGVQINSLYLLLAVMGYAMNVIRGLVIDKEKGNLVKADCFGYVKRAMHGTKLLCTRVVRWLIDWMKGLFHLILAVGKALFRAHVEGQLKSEIMSKPELFIEPDPELPLAPLDQKELGCQGFEVDEQYHMEEGSSMTPGTHEEINWFQAMFGFLGLCKLIKDMIYGSYVYLQGPSMAQGTHEEIDLLQDMFVFLVTMKSQWHINLIRHKFLYLQNGTRFSGGGFFQRLEMGGDRSSTVMKLESATAMVRNRIKG